MRFSKRLNRAKWLIKRFIATYEVSPILMFDLDKGTITLGFERLPAKGCIETLKPVNGKLNGILIRALLEGMPKPSEISRMIDKRIRLMMEREKQKHLISSSMRDVQGIRPEKRESQLLRLGEAARMLGVSYKTLWRQSKEGMISAKRLPSGHSRYYKHEIEKLKSKRTRNLKSSSEGHPL